MKENPSSKFPGFMSFKVDPQQGPSLNAWRMKPYREWGDWGRQEELFKNVSKNTMFGSFVGSGIGAVGSFLALARLSGTFDGVKKVKSYVEIGCVLGGLFGAMRGIYISNQFFLDRPIVIHATYNSSVKAKQIIEAFVRAQIGSPQIKAEITCPISHEIMVYPVKVDCGSTVSHTFEYFSILKWLDDHESCPMCHRKVRIKGLKLDEKKEQEIHETVAIVFTTMEAILNRLPKRFLGLDILPNFSESEQIKALSKKVKQGQKFLALEVDQITEKLKTPEALSEEEAFALAHFLVHQFKPMKHKIDQVYITAGDYLRKLRTEERIDGDTYQTQLRELENWYARFNVIPAHCKIIRKLYKL